MALVYREVGSSNLKEIYDDLGGIHEIADELGVSRYRVERWIERRRTTRCPIPVRQLQHVNIYSLVEWRVWFKHRIDKKGFDGRRTGMTSTPDDMTFNPGNWR